jgi:hypothetical protein
MQTPPIVAIQRRSPRPVAPNLVPTSIDESLLTIAEPKPLRHKTHLRFVAAQHCIFCGRQPSDPHHLRFAQPRAVGMKVSDEFTVPLCRGHQLHQAGNEKAWWEDLDINALEIAKDPWKESHARSAPIVDASTSRTDGGSAIAENSASVLPTKT